MGEFPTVELQTGNPAWSLQSTRERSDMHGTAIPRASLGWRMCHAHPFYVYIKNPWIVAIEFSSLRCSWRLMHLCDVAGVLGASLQGPLLPPVYLCCSRIRYCKFRCVSGDEDGVQSDWFLSSPPPLPPSSKHKSITRGKYANR